MSNNRTSSKNGFRIVAGLLAIGIVALVVKVLIAPKPLLMTQPEFVIPCTAPGDCQNPPTGKRIPTCTDLGSLTCHAPETGAGTVCFFRIKDAPGCMCIEGDVKVCTLSGGGTGISTCVKVDGRTTKWGACNSTC